MEGNIMFDDIGGKIKTLAVVLCVIGIILSVISAIALWAQNDTSSYYNPHPTILLGFGVLIGGCLGSWLGSFFMYGFGQLIETTEENNQYLAQISRQLSKPNTDAAASSSDSTPRAYTPSYSNSNASLSHVTRVSGDGWVCKKCGTRNSSSADYCKDCGTYR